MTAEELYLMPRPVYHPLTVGMNFPLLAMRHDNSANDGGTVLEFISRYRDTDLVKGEIDDGIERVSVQLIGWFGHGVCYGYC